MSSVQPVLSRGGRYYGVQVYGGINFRGIIPWYTIFVMKAAPTGLYKIGNRPYLKKYFKKRRNMAFSEEYMPIKI